MRLRVGPLVARALVVTGALPVLAFAALASPSTAHADPCVAVLCPTASADPSPTVTHTTSPTPTRSPTARPRVTATYTRSPRPRPTYTSAVPTTTPTPAPDPTPTAEPTTTAPVVKPVQKSTTAGPKLAKLAALVVGGALLLGVGGVSGLYLTRTRP